MASFAAAAAETATAAAEDITITLNDDEVTILGEYEEINNPFQRLIVLVTLDKEYEDLLGNKKTKLPFYRSSGKNSGKKGMWFPFLGFVSWRSKDEARNDMIIQTLKYIEQVVKKIIREKGATALNYITTEFNDIDFLNNNFVPQSMLIKCPYFEEAEFKDKCGNDLNMSEIFTAIPEEKRVDYRICNEYQKKYSEALTKYFEQLTAERKQQIEQFDVGNAEKIINTEIYKKGGSVFGINLYDAISDKREEMRKYLKGYKKVLEEYEGDERLVGDVTYSLNMIQMFSESLNAPTTKDICDLLDKKHTEKIQTIETQTSEGGKRKFKPRNRKIRKKNIRKSKHKKKRYKRKNRKVTCKRKNKKNMICVKGNKKKTRKLAKYSKKLNMKLTKCSKKRIKK